MCAITYHSLGYHYGGLGVFVDRGEGVWGSPLPGLGSGGLELVVVYVYYFGRLSGEPRAFPEECYAC